MKNKSSRYKTTFQELIAILVIALVVGSIINSAVNSRSHYSPSTKAEQGTHE